MVKLTEQDRPFITEVPLTAEAREKLIEQLFVDELPRTGEVFVPDDDFYYGTSSHKKAEHMVKVLCRWTGIKPGYIGLEFESGSSKTPDGKRYTIYLESSTLKDEFVLGAYLAYTLTRYLIEERKQIFLPEADQQAALLASASIVFGLGLVVANGISPAYSWVSRFRQHDTHLLKNFPAYNYSQMTLNFLHKYRIDQNIYVHSLTPWTLKRMGLPKQRRTSHAIRDARHHIRVANAKLVGVCWILLLVVFIGGFVFIQRVRPLPRELAEASEKVSLFSELTRLCEDALAYDRRYSDTSDIQTMRSLNAEALRCQSLRNQHEAAERHYNQLLNK